MYIYVDGHENDDDNHDVDDNVYKITSTTTICNLDSVNYPRPHSSFISMLLIVIHLCTFCSGTRLHVFCVRFVSLAFTYICMFLQIVGKQCNDAIKSNG